MCSTSAACDMLYHGSARRAENLPPEGFLNALSNPFGCYCLKEKSSLSAASFFGPPEGIRTPDLQNRKQISQTLKANDIKRFEI